MKYKILINGKNFKLKEANGILDSGFFTNVFVEAENEQIAESIDVNLLREDEELSDIVVNESDNLPILTVMEIEIIKKWPIGVSLPRTRLQVYDETE